MYPEFEFWLCLAEAGAVIGTCALLIFLAAYALIIRGPGYGGHKDRVRG